MFVCFLADLFYLSRLQNIFLFFYSQKHRRILFVRCKRIYVCLSYHINASHTSRREHITRREQKNIKTKWQTI